MTAASATVRERNEPDALCRPCDDWLMVNAAAEAGGKPVQESLFDVVNIQDGREPI